MVQLIQLSLPVLVIVLFIQFKLNHDHKRLLFKFPVWISSTVLSFVIAHGAKGVMGFYAAIFCDILLYPTMVLMKKAWERKEQKQKPELRSMSQALPNV